MSDTKDTSITNIRALYNEIVDTPVWVNAHQTLLLLASEIGDSGVVEAILDATTDIPAPLYAATIAACDGGHIDTIAILSKYAYDIPSFWTGVARAGMIDDRFDVIRLAADSGYGLVEAVELNKPNVVEYLLRNQYCPDLHQEALLVACRNGYGKIVVIMFNRGIRMDDAITAPVDGSTR